MKKRTGAFIAGLAATAALTANVYAMDLNYYGNDTLLVPTGGVENTLNFEGDLNSNGSNRMATLIIMKPGETLANVSDPTKIAHFETVSVNYDGTFEYKFSFDQSTGVYPVYIKCDGEADYEGEYRHKNWNTGVSSEVTDSVVELFAKINTDSENLKFTELEDFSQAMGLDLSVVTKEGYKATVLKRVAGKAAEFTAPYTQSHVEKLQKTITDTAMEFKELEKIITAEHYSHIPSVLTKLTELTGITYNYNGASQSAVCNALLSREFFSAEDVQSAFNTAVTNALTTPPQTGGSSTTTGGGSTSIGGGAARPTIMPSGTTPSSPNAFTDIDSVEWAVKAINTLYSKGVINGKADGIFAPNDNLKREEIVKILVLGFNIPTTTELAGFADVNNNEWYAEFIARAKVSGVVDGISDTLFGIGSNVTRQDIAVMIYRAAKSVGIGFTKTKTDFADYDTVSDYAKEAVSALAGEGVINGFDDNTFRPLAPATRAEAAKMVYSAIGGDK